MLESTRYVSADEFRTQIIGCAVVGISAAVMAWDLQRFEESEYVLIG